MEIDARGLADGTVLDTDLCIVGAGPAGLTLAHALSGRGLDVVLLESGGTGPEPEPQALNAGGTAGDPYAGLRQSRHRQVGGTSGIWNTPVHGEPGAKFVPLDAVDFEARPGRPLTGWPFAFGVLEPYYRRAHAVCGLGTPVGDAAPGAGPEPWPGAGPLLVPRLYTLGTRRALLDGKLAALRAAGNPRLVHHATALRLETDGAGRQVRWLDAVEPGGAWLRIRAGRYVLAAGAVENARLLLVSTSAAAPAGPGNGSGWVGRCFMEHPRDTTLMVRVRTRDAYRRVAFFDQWTTREGVPVVGRLGLRDATLRDGRLPNAAATLLPRIRPGLLRLRAALGRAGRLPGMRSALPRAGHGWSRHPAPERAFEGFTILLNVEQAPHPDNRVVPGVRRDAFGVPLPVLHWRWRAEDQERLERLRRLVASELEASGLGRLESIANGAPDPNAHHHAGTTRMHDDPRQGVVDADGRIHGVDNLYVTGASVFPTAGFANPALTIVALALRLADHLAPVPAGTTGLRR